MLRQGQIDRRITNIALAENAKLEGLGKTARQLLAGGPDETMKDQIFESFHEGIEQFKDGHKFVGSVVAVGSIMTLPFTAALVAGGSLISNFRVARAQAKEQSNIQSLIDAGVITAAQVPQMISKINAMDAFERTMGLEYDDLGLQEEGVSR